MSAAVEARLAEIEAEHAAVEARARGDMDTGDGMQAHEDRGDLLDMIRAASEALTAAGIRDDGRTLAELIRGVANDARITRDVIDAKIHDRHVVATARHDADILRRAAVAAATTLGAVLPDDAGPKTIAGELRAGAERVKMLATVAGRGPAPDVGEVSPAHLRALEIIAYSDGTAAQIALAGELVGMGPAAVAEAVCRAYEEGRAAEARRPTAAFPAPKRCDDCGGTDEPHGHRFGCGMEPEGEPFTGLDNFEASFGSGREAWNTPEGRRFIREMRGGLDDCGVPPEPDIEPAVGDLPPEAR